MENNFKALKSLNFVYGENGITGMVTTNQAIANFRKELIESNKRNLQTIKDSICFIPVSELVNLSGTDFGGYIEKIFSGNVTYDGINGVDDLLALVETVAAERGITEPCISYIDVNGDRLIVTGKCYGEEDVLCERILFLNAEVKFDYDYGYEHYTEYEGLKYGCGHPDFEHYWEFELGQYDHDYVLTTEIIFHNSCSCEIECSNDAPKEIRELPNYYCCSYHPAASRNSLYTWHFKFDREHCKGCKLYEDACRSVKGKIVIHIKAI